MEGREEGKPVNDEKTTSRSEQVALFRYGLIADLIHYRRGERGLYARLDEKAAKSYAIPGSSRTRVAAETMRGWLRDWHEGGFDALRPKPRADQGRARAIPQPIADLLCCIKEEKPALSVALVIAEAMATGDVPADVTLAPATVHRLLSRQGLMQKHPQDPTTKDRRRFAFEDANELWMSDVMHGPAVTTEGRRKQRSYLIGLIDDATRLIPYAAFALAENTAAFLPVLEQAIRRRGLPKRLYVDNGAVYRTHHLALVCAKLGITLIHSRPYVPQGRGKVERWFRTVRLQLLPTLAPADTASLDALNRRLWAYVEGEYHLRPHKGLDGQTPLDRWTLASGEVRVPGPELDLGQLFLFEEKRKVAKDRTVSLRGVLYEVDAVLVGETVTLRFDPTRPTRPVEVWHKGGKVEVARPVNAYANCFVTRDHSRKTFQVSKAPDAPPPAGLRLRDFGNGEDEKGGE
jgi:transposase InsO family protein